MPQNIDRHDDAVEVFLSVLNRKFAPGEEEKLMESLKDLDFRLPPRKLKEEKMSQTKQECMEYILVLLDDMKSQVRKIMHKDNYQTYDNTVPDTMPLYNTLCKIDEELSDLDDMFEKCLPEEIKKTRHLELENEVLKDTASCMQRNMETLKKKISDLEHKLAFTPLVKKEKQE